jgi:hypothetical protein
MIHSRTGRDSTIFDIFNLRILPVTLESIPDPSFLEHDKAAVSHIIKTTCIAERETIRSAVFYLLNG